jgi:diguanylate cyclase (GGDEF)-like protein
MRVRAVLAVILGLIGVGLGAADVARHEPRLALVGIGVVLVGMLLALGTGRSPRQTAVVAFGELEAGSSEARGEADAPEAVAVAETAGEVRLEDVSEDPITDPVTGLMNEIFFSGLLGTKLATARRRLWPLSVVLLQVHLGEELSEAEVDDAIRAFSDVVRGTIRTADVVCRVGQRTFALVLDDTDEDGGAWVAERVQIAQARQQTSGVVRISAGVASYPSHGIEPTEILVTAKIALKQAAESVTTPGLGRVVVAPQRPM